MPCSGRTFCTSTLTHAAAARAGDDGLTRALVTERIARKPTAEAAARRLVTENGGSLDALRW